jgi:hypothetical protein
MKALAITARVAIIALTGFLLFVVLPLLEPVK